MKYITWKLHAVLLFGLGLTELQAQVTIPANGGNASGSGGSVSYSAGQVAYTTITGTNGSVAQGVQQAFEISVVSALKEAIGVNLSLSAFPNPATDFLILKADASATLTTQTMVYQLFDMKGNLLESKILVTNETRIAMDKFMPAGYFLKIIENNKEVKVFKIIKSQ